MPEVHSGSRAPLVARLGQYHPHDAREVKHKEAVVAWLAKAQRPLDRTVYTPGHATGSAFVVSTEKRLALVYHHKLGRWLQPGGHAEPGETDLAITAAREATEELGIEVHPDALTLFDLDVHEIPSCDAAPAHLHFDFRFLGIVPPSPLRPGDDAADARWFTVTEAHALTLDRGLERAIAKAADEGMLV